MSVRVVNADEWAVHAATSEFMRTHPAAVDRCRPHCADHCPHPLSERCADAAHSSAMARWCQWKSGLIATVFCSTSPDDNGTQ